jgi:hypothetical protein
MPERLAVDSGRLGSGLVAASPVGPVGCGNRAQRLTSGSAVGTRAGSGHARCLCRGLCFTSSCVASFGSWCCSVVVTAVLAETSSMQVRRVEVDRRVSGVVVVVDHLGTAAWQVAAAA